MIVFTSGSCRGSYPSTWLHIQGKIDLINPHWDTHRIGLPPTPPMELCHNHNILDHLRLFRLLEDDSDKEEIKKALFMLCDKKHKRYRSDWQDVWEYVKTKWKQCDIAVIEISSPKPRCPDLKKVDLKDTPPLMKELETIVGDRRVLWVNHFRPSIIWPERKNNHNTKSWNDTREEIHQVVLTGKYHFDPSPYLAESPDEYLHDQDHYGPKGIKYVAEKIYEKFISLR